MTGRKRGNGKRATRNRYYSCVYPDPITHSSMVGGYSRYPGMFLISLILIGILAGITPAGNAFIDFNNLAG